MTGGQPHPPDEALVAAADADLGEDSRIVRGHLASCERCRLRSEQLDGVRVLLKDAAFFERAPRDDVVPSVVKRLRLRRHAITNANELLNGLVAFVRGLGSLFSAGDRNG
ncbi:MAG: hypothetical protein IAI49_00665 [Candidatus Eremiobacteraeota bacterium]|nr:hypothetical protein [Candidatus Eremiobacteraeota bacterium]